MHSSSKVAATRKAARLPPLEAPRAGGKTLGVAAGTEVTSRRSSARSRTSTIEHRELPARASQRARHADEGRVSPGPLERGGTARGEHAATDVHAEPLQ